MKTARLVINTVLILAQTAVMVSTVAYWRYMQIGFVSVMLLINGKEIVTTVVELGKKMLKKGKNF